MPEKTIASFSIRKLSIMDEKGHVDEKLLPRLSHDTILKMYKSMVLGRLLDPKLLAMQRQGRISTYIEARGQEACQVGPIFALKKSDMIFPAFRETIAMITRGVPIENVLLYYGGDERGNKIPRRYAFFPVSIPVGSQSTHAVGYAYALKLHKKPNVSLTYFGDGATSEGECMEAMNFAGVWKTPTIFLCQNNQYAISTKHNQQTAAETYAQKAIAFGFEGIQVDGNDIFAVYKAVALAAKKARAGEGPTLIECFTYRLCDHTTSDDAKKYRDPKEVQELEKKDPITRLRLFIRRHTRWDKIKEGKLRKICEKEIDAAIKRWEKIPHPDISDMFTHTYASMPTELQEQLEEISHD
ncbi:TPA: pyruvate dehydrogenase (acetyl-transferring) E1 component subunit alpha [Candidatus Woesearchaeota archaeon]|nr:pyruvate dehydrogenase (acetyl-transferring) E1 component subunit alpha [Candidatus Woesearchaeota archaeon]